MEAYAILDGGGVLGAALAGCLKAAEDQGIHFVGYGGTSAGSIVALLGALGYSGEEIQVIAVETDFANLLVDKGEPVERFKSEIGIVEEQLKSGSGWKAFCALRRIKNLLNSLGTSFGIDDGSAMKLFLMQAIRDRLEAMNRSLAGQTKPKAQAFSSRLKEILKEDPKITFRHLEEIGCLPLKVVASDVTRRRPVIFSKDDTTLGDSVVEAIRASTCLPFLFQPSPEHNRWLVDGGLASNLPAFLFQKEQQRTGYPVFAFDLTYADETPPGKVKERPRLDLKGFGRSILSTALDAGDELMRSVLKGVIHVEVPIPDEFDFLDFRMDKVKRQRLFDIGYRKTNTFLGRLELLKIARQAGDELQRSLQARHGPPILFEIVLASLARDIEEMSNATDVRASIMLPTGRDPGTRIVVYSSGMLREFGGVQTWDSDRALELGMDEGCSGRAWSSNEPSVADLTKSRINPEAWGMSKEKHDLVPSDRKSMLSLPIGSSVGLNFEERGSPIGTLTIDSNTELANTGWLEGLQNFQSEVIERMIYWETIIRRMLK
jgi:NTE family protein